MNFIYSTFKKYVLLTPIGVFCDIVDGLDEACFENNLLDLWDYQEDVIRNLSRQDILNDVNTLRKSSLTRVDYSTLLGQVSYH